MGNKITIHNSVTGKPHKVKVRKTKHGLKGAILKHNEKNLIALSISHGHPTPKSAIEAEIYHQAPPAEEKRLGEGPLSRAFHKFAMMYLNEYGARYVLVQEASRNLQQFWHDPNPQIMKRIEEKMVKGAIEHGEPKMAVDSIQKEIEDEIIDIVIWMLLKKWRAFRVASEIVDKAIQEAKELSKDRK